MTTDIDPAFADRCATAAGYLRALAALGAHPDGDEAAGEHAGALTVWLLTDPESLLAVALTAAQLMEAVRLRLVEVLQQDPVRRVPDDEPLQEAADLVAGDLMQARARLDGIRGAPSCDDDPSTLEGWGTRDPGDEDRS